MGVAAGLEKKIGAEHRHHHHHASDEQCLASHAPVNPSPLHSMLNATIAQGPNAPQQHNTPLLASGKLTDSLSPPPSTAAVHGNAGLNEPIASRHIRHASLKIRTDAAFQHTDLPHQPMTAGAKPPSPFGSSHHHHNHQQQQQSPAGVPKSLSSSVGPIVIKRTTSFSQRIHNLLHRDKSHKHPTAVQLRQAPAPSAAPFSAFDAPTIAYRTPTTQTHSTDVSANASATVSANNSPPRRISPEPTSASLAKDASAISVLPSSYRAESNFEPVPVDSVFAVSSTNLRSVQRHNNQIRKSINQSIPECQEAIDRANQQHRQRQPLPFESPLPAVDDIVRGLEDASIEHLPAALESRDESAHSMSREPSQSTLHHSQSAADMHAADEVGSSEEDLHSHHARHRHDDDHLGHELHLAGKTLPSKAPVVTVLDDAKHRLAAGTTHDPNAPSAAATSGALPECALATPPKKATPLYSTHKATLNQFGRQTKVIGKGTGGTVRLLQGVEVDARPPSLRSGPPSHHGDDADPGVYVPSEHRLFAVKEFRKRRPDETPRAYMKKVTSEFCIGSSIHQENVIETLDLIFESDRVYEIMEYCPHDLFTFVAMGDMDLDETFCWFKQVCQGVQYLHKIGIAHRDLKLENCLLTDRGIVKIIDFGCATVFKTPFQKEPSKVVGVCGSDPYIAPEVLLSRRQVPYYAHVADIWSVGIMYMCMTLLKFPWRIADTETDRNYGSYIREWPRGREKLFAQLPKLRHDGQKVIEGMVYPDVKGRLSMEDVMDSEWMKEIDVCHTIFPAKAHTHHMKSA
ncbi:serine/threonine protein kinase [Coemansia thaxteri]|uniref:non-specific serine/threonine protein kinase n=1 Tax=Coemansia thaxteri TaxID=2663907 RepID=A0A9W8BHT2_9FUNG|nr:serine/threonine protein kinase [Coemansia thaxteri]KAJ2003620.1 serine/threonine protein kinase [Coemansia thaxteri]KAJ2469283.1 serine/threonine protein kinase [Coemansia sp. RSA 2322]KAJ2478115.1 serine/threonine protein kinase [Coemansia sp. RSA 2320]